MAAVETEEKINRFEVSLGDVIFKKCIGRVTLEDEGEGEIKENSQVLGARYQCHFIEMRKVGKRKIISVQEKSRPLS